jgi:hypothetical protein
MNAIKEFNHAVIVGRRWFSRSGGNTYHSVTVKVDGQHVGSADFVYGYGDCYRQTAHSILQDAGFYAKTGEALLSGANKDYNEFFCDTIDHRERFTFVVSDVSRKRDL